MAMAPAAPTLARDRVEGLLQSLTDAPGPSGYEEEVRAIMVRELKPFASQISYDGLGSVIAQHGTTGPRIMLDAHMDELGGIVRRVTADGFLSMQMVGGWLDQALVGQRWIILGSKGPVYAVTGIRDIHVLPSAERSRSFARDEIFLDLGVKNPAEVARPQIGIAIEGGVSGDVPGARPEETQARLGAGPGVFLYDFLEQPNRRLVGLIKDTARTEKIPLQFDLVNGYGDDSSEIQRSNGGVPTVNIVVPVRYTHAHNGIMDRSDFDQTVALVVALIKRLDAPTVKRLRDFAP